MQLGEGGIAVGAALAAAHGQRAAGAAARGKPVVDVDIFRAQRREHEARVLEHRHRAVDAQERPALAQHVRGRNQVEVVIELPAAAGHELHPARVQRVGLLVGGLQAGAVPAVQPGECRDAVLQGQGLALLRIVELRKRLVTMHVEVPLLGAQAHAGAALGAVAGAGQIDAARRGRQVDLHRHLFVDCLLGLWQDLDHAEVIQRHQRLPQPFELGLVEGIAAVPVDQLAQQRIADDRSRCLLEIHIAKRVACTAGPAQGDVGGLVGARYLHPVRGEVGIEVALRGEPPADPRFAGFVQRVLEHVALARYEVRQRLLHCRVIAGRAVHADVEAADTHRLPGIDADAHAEGARSAGGRVGCPILIAASVAGGICRRCRRFDPFGRATVAALDHDHRRVVAERFQRLAGFDFRLPQQVGQPARGHVLADRVAERQLQSHVVRHQWIGQAADIHAGDGGRHRR